MTKDPLKNRQYVAKSRAKLIARIGIEEYRRRNAAAQRAYRAKRKALKKEIMSNIDNRFYINDPSPEQRSGLYAGSRIRRFRV
jgi:hypothetical protein